MSARLIARYADDPRVVTLIITTLVAGVLWLATWLAMGDMMDMGGMGGMSGEMPGMSDMSGQSGQTGSEMSGMGEMSGESTGGMSGMGQMSNESTDGMSGMGQMSGEGMGSSMEGTMGSSMGMGEMAMDMPGMSMNPADWSAQTIGVTIAMWVLMMAAMMLPAMAPVMAIYAGLAAKEDKGARLAFRIFVFTSGYFLLWAVVSVAGALGQLALRGSEWFSMGGTLAGPYAAGALMIAAGVYQFTPVKEFCLRHCRHPLTYLMSHWKEGLAGAFPVGARHGVYCVGCCIALMGLLFVFGAMNVLWMAAITLYFLAEKILPAVELWSRAFGALLIGAGLATLVHTAI